VDEFLQDHPWIGERLFGGRRVIPLGRPRDEIARGQVALIGDAARQVFAAHGSGIGAGLIAAQMLAEAIAGGSGPEDYAVAWQRRYGGLFAAVDRFRRFSESLTPSDLTALMEAGLVDETVLGAALAQQLPRLPLDDVAARLRGLSSAPTMVAPLAGLGARMAATMALYAAYPRERRERKRWSRLARWVAGGVG
jgi:flavin-dependent dehydrogenase